MNRAVHPLKLPIAAGNIHTWNVKKDKVRNLQEFNPAWTGAPFCMIGGLTTVSCEPPRKPQTEKKAPRELVKKTRNEAHIDIVTNIYVIVFICLYCISFHYGENPIFTGQPIPDKLPAKPSIVIFPSSLFFLVVKTKSVTIPQGYRSHGNAYKVMLWQGNSQ